MLDLGALKAKIVLDDKDATKGMNNFGDTTEKTEGRLKKFAGNVGGMAKTAMVGFAGAATAVGAAMVGVAANALETTETIEKFSATCNVSTEEFQRLDGVFKTMGWTMEDAAGDFAALSEKMMEAAQTGEGEAYEMFSKLGVSVSDASGQLRNTGDVFNDMILSLQNVEDATERQAIASIMLGTTSEELAPLLKMTNEEFIAMKENVNVIEDEQLEQAKEFKKSWDSLKQTFSTVVTELGIALMPMFQALADWINQHMPEIQAVIEVVFGIVTTVIGAVVDAISGLIGWFESLLANNEELREGLTKVWENVKNMYSRYFKELEELIGAFIDWCTSFWGKYGQDIIAIAKQLWDIVQNIFGTAFDVIIEAINFFTAMFTGDFEGMKEAITNIIDSLWEGIKDLFNEGIDFLFNFVPTLFNIGCDLFNSLWDGLKSIWSGITSWVSDKVDWMMDKLMFWRDAEDEMSSSSSNSRSSRSAEIDGSHRNGLSYVPFDGYIAELHKGERVLTQEQAKNYQMPDTSRIESLLEKVNKSIERLPKDYKTEQRLGFL